MQVTKINHYLYLFPYFSTIIDFSKNAENDNHDHYLMFNHILLSYHGDFGAITEGKVITVYNEQPIICPHPSAYSSRYPMMKNINKISDV